MGYSDCITPPVIQRNILENPGWYTQYTPYQAEIAQGRLEALLNFQTMVADLTGLPLANASLLDEGTAAAEAMALCHGASHGGEDDRNVFFVADDCHPQTIAVVADARRRRWASRCVVGDHAAVDFDAARRVFGVLLQYPTTDGRDASTTRALAERAHAAGALVVVAADLLALAAAARRRASSAPTSRSAARSASACRWATAARTPPSSRPATSTSARCPAASSASRRTRSGKPALRMALQTREQHIRREKATSNICTAQVLLAVMAGMYAVYHGPEGLRRIAERVHGLTAHPGRGPGAGWASSCAREPFFDTLRVDGSPDQSADAVLAAAERARHATCAGSTPRRVGIALDETTTRRRRRATCWRCSPAAPTTSGRSLEELAAAVADIRRLSDDAARRTRAVPHAPGLQQRTTPRPRCCATSGGSRRRDLSLTTSMIPLGSCTMKLNATAEMMPVTWPEFGRPPPVRAGRAGRGLPRDLRDARGAGWPRSPASPPSRCSPTPARRASTPACW